MPIPVQTAELARTFRIWLTVLAQRRPALLRDLWTRRGEDADRLKLDHARSELARELAERLAVNKWEVTREPTPQEQLGGEPLRAGRAASADGGSNGGDAT